MQSSLFIALRAAFDLCQMGQRPSLWEEIFLIHSRHYEKRIRAIGQRERLLLYCNTAEADLETSHSRLTRLWNQGLPIIAPSLRSDGQS